MRLSSILSNTSSVAAIGLRLLKFDSKSLASLLAYTVFVTSHIGEMLKEKIKNAMSEVNYFLII